MGIGRIRLRNVEEWPRVWRIGRGEVDEDCVGEVQTSRYEEGDEGDGNINEEDSCEKGDSDEEEEWDIVEELC